MGLKFKGFLLSIVVIITTTMFCGCDLWSNETTPTRPPITTGVITNDKENDPNFNESNEDLVEEDGVVDESQLYEFLDGIKFAYDGKSHKLDVLNDAKFDAVYSRVATYLEDNVTIDSQKFIESNAELGVDATYISRVVWLYNYINEYKTLARMILTNLSKVYGYGIGDNYIQQNNLYGNLYYLPYEIEDNGDFTSYKNAINAGVYEVSPTLIALNPYFGMGDAVFDNGESYIDFNNSEYIDFDLGVDVPSKVYSFICNLNNNGSRFTFTVSNPYYDPSNIVNQPTIPNPDYNPEDSQSEEYIDNKQYIPNHILGMSEISFVGNVDEFNTITYELGTTTITEPDANTFAYDYTLEYEDYLALRLLETHLKTSQIYQGEHINIVEQNFWDLYPQWTEQVNKFGFDETYTDANSNEYNLVEEFTNCVYEYIIGYDTLDIDSDAGAYSRDLYNNVLQIVNDCVNAKVTYSDDYYSFDDINGQEYFVEVYNIEYQDYTAEQIFADAKQDEENGDNNQSAGSEEEYEDNLFFFPDEIIYSMVVMLKPEFEPVVMQNIMLLMLAPYSELNVDLSFRYVKEGQEKIFDKIDYSAKPENEGSTTEDTTGDDIIIEDEVISNTFEGVIPKYEGEELGLEFVDECIFALEDYNTPKLDTIKNKEILLEKFSNNLASSSASALNASLGNLRYSYNEELNNYYYNENSTDCDYVEINFNVTTQTQEATMKRIRLVIYALYFDTLSSSQEDATQQ